MTQPSVRDRVGGFVNSLAGVVGGAGGGGPAAPSTKAMDIAQARKTIEGLSPNPDAFEDPEEYAIAFSTWLDTYLSTLDAEKALQLGKWETVELPDGTLMPIGDLTDEERAVFEAANDARYQQALEAAGLSQARLVAERAQADFNNRMERIDQKIKVDDQRLRKSESEVERQLGGLSESRARAQAIASAKMEAAPFATRGGKTSFSGNELGSLLGEFSRFAGVDPNASLLNYTGTTMIDPEADMGRFDSLLGVGGPLAGIAGLGAGEGEFGIPGLPDLGALPSVSAPQRLDISSLLQAAGGGESYNLNNDVINSLLAKALGGGAGSRDTGMNATQRSYFGDGVRTGPPTWEAPGGVYGETFRGAPGGPVYGETFRNAPRGTSLLTAGR